MARTYANYSVPSPDSQDYQHARSWMSARLVELAWMSQGVVAAVPGGPEWSFHRGGHEVTTKPGLTLTLADGRAAYWSALEKRYVGELPDWAQVQQFHASRLGADSWVLTDDYIQRNPVEFTNRTDAFYFMAHARGWDSSEVECEVLMAVHPKPLSLAELAGKCNRPISHVQAAALRLWRKRLVELPMATQPMNEQWLVRGAPHGHQ